MKNKMFLFAILTLLTLSLCACAGETECTHSKTHEELINEGDCFNGSYSIVKCDECGKNVNEIHEEPLGHSETDIPEVAPTCTESGSKNGKKCQRCGSVTVQPTIVSATGHQFLEDDKCASCDMTRMLFECMYTITEDGGGYILTDATGYSGTHAAIPSEFRGLPVVGIGKSAFNSSNIESVVIPSSVKFLEMLAFFKCEKLTSVTLSEGLEDIGLRAFDSCGITEITIPASVKSLGNGELYPNDAGPFINCKSLVSVEFSVDSKITEIPYGTFISCESLTTVKNLPATLKVIGKEAFAQSKISEITLPAGLLTIERGAFLNTSLVSVSIPSSVESIGAGAFSTLTLKNVEINLLNTAISYKLSDVLGVACDTVNELKLQGANFTLFSDTLNGLTAVTIIEIGRSVTSIPEGIFDNIATLLTVVYRGTEQEWNNLIGSYILPVGLEVVFS